jgi:hypothetical protein
MSFSSPFAKRWQRSPEICQMFFAFVFSPNGRKTDDFRSRKASRSFFEDKTHRKLTAETLFDINAPVTKITVFETGEGIGERSGDTLGEGNGRAVCSCY